MLLASPSAVVWVTTEGHALAPALFKACYTLANVLNLYAGYGEREKKNVTQHASPNQTVLDVYWVYVDVFSCHNMLHDI